MIQHAIDAENELQTITNIADRAAHRNSKPYAARQNTQQRQPHTFFSGTSQDQQEEYPEEYSDQYGRSNANAYATLVSITHMIRYTIPFIDKGEQCFITLGLTDDLPIDTLFGLGFQQDTKMTINFTTRRVESAFLQRQFPITFKEPRRTNPENIRSQENNAPKSLLTTDE